MKFPICENVELVLADRESVEIDHCPTCRGVWLDRGELDTFIDVGGCSRSAQPGASCSHGARR